MKKSKTVHSSILNAKHNIATIEVNSTTETPVGVVVEHIVEQNFVDFQKISQATTNPYASLVNQFTNIEEVLSETIIQQPTSTKPQKVKKYRPKTQKTSNISQKVQKEEFIYKNIEQEQITKTSDISDIAKLNMYATSAPEAIQTQEVLFAGEVPTIEPITQQETPTNNLEVLNKITQEETKTQKTKDIKAETQELNGMEALLASLEEKDGKDIGFG